MKKKIAVFVTSLVLIAAIAIPTALAATPEDSKTSKFFESMFDFHRKWVDKSVKNGEITEEEAQNYNEHFDTMEKYHDENGFEDHCGGAAGPGNGPNNQSFRSQFNGGMMGSSGGMMSSFSNEL
ncbi:DUF2680 domain-containing protein [Petroclostridium sp. X23]|uniref:DUF2680 domain-containing protein n=1 Tax=Petroclostridium sp. X23 TaxID=3045146 RepID=UPI0024ACF781|nr:DUF2680 domain-containing protein [Petroclostridium sp. X23]WHH59971.1 DUF2680 domain-containing protein [Petroclostridium sp. X23]